MRAGGALPLFIINLQIKEALQSKEAFHVVKVLCRRRVNPSFFEEKVKRKGQSVFSAHAQYEIMV